MKLQKIVVVGLGYVGLPLAVACARKGHQVFGIDIDEEKVVALREGKSPVEDVSEREISELLKDGKLNFSLDYSEAARFDVALLALPTPLIGNLPDISALVSASKELGSRISTTSIVIVESTVFPGCTEDVLIPVLESSSGLKAGKDFMVGYSPERINPGDKEWNLLNTPKVISGMDENSRLACEGFYNGLGIPTHNVTTVRTAEFTKLLENTFRFVNISLVNELMTVAEDLGIDIWESIDAADSKPFGFVKFTPGPGIGGHCLPIDSVYLSWAAEQTSGNRLKIIDAASDVNSRMPLFVADQVSRELASRSSEVTGARILLMGLAYKAEIGDLREAPSIKLAEILTDMGAEVWGIDPCVSEQNWPGQILRGKDTSFHDFDVAVLMTAHSSGEWTNGILQSGTPIIDTRNYFDGEAVTKLGKMGSRK